MCAPEVPLPSLSRPWPATHPSDRDPDAWTCVLANCEVDRGILPTRIRVTMWGAGALQTRGQTMNAIRLTHVSLALLCASFLALAAWLGCGEDEAQDPGPQDLPELAAAFRATPVQGDTPLDVTFEDLSTGAIVEAAWDFGDGDTSAERSPAHTYTAPGIYTVSLTVTDANGISDAVTKPDLIRVGISIFTAPADAPWTDTGLLLAEGTRVTIVGEGDWLLNKNDPNDPRHDVNGDPLGNPGVAGPPGTPGWTSRTCNGGSLIGRLGEDGEPFQIGEFIEFTVGEDARYTNGLGETHSAPTKAGVLYLGVNDSVFADNDGAVTVTVTR